MSLTQSLALGIIVLTLAGVAVGRYPWLRMNRASIALVGATALVLVGALELEDAYRAVDLNTLVLLLGMMVLNANLRLAGFFPLVMTTVARRARTPRALLALVIASSGLLSALFLNDTIVLMFTPLVVTMTLALRLNPVPYLVGLVTAANIGSVATIVGNPQNMLIGMASGIPFARFTLHLLPLALAGLALAWVVIVLVYRREFAARTLPPLEPLRFRLLRPLLWKSLVAGGLLVAALLAGLPIPLAALVGAGFVLVTRRVKPRRVFAEIDWALLVFFAGLFVVTQAIGLIGLDAQLLRGAHALAAQGVGALAAAAAVVSNVVSNVPAVLLFKPYMSGFADPERAWLVLAMATTFAGNLTLLGSVANLIVAETARGQGVHLGFVEYLRAGVPVTLLTLVVGVLWFALLPPA